MQNNEPQVDRELWDAVRALDLSTAPVPFVCQSCRQDNETEKFIDLVAGDDPFRRFLYQAIWVNHNLCLLCGGKGS